MLDLDRRRLVLYAALGVAICLLGARYISAHSGAAGVDAAPGEGPAARVAHPGGGAVTARRGERSDAGVAVVRAGGGHVTVHVAGAVRRPGLYRLASGARIDDALRRAGGPGRRADLAAVNLAARLEDGRQILVPERAPAGRTAGAAAPAVAGGSVAAAPVNINTATLEQLDTLDGIGPGLAQRILDHRAEHGGFARVDELAEVPGIGPKRLAALRPLVTA